jgi:hypothetical protein
MFSVHSKIQNLIEIRPVVLQFKYTARQTRLPPHALTSCVLYNNSIQHSFVPQTWIYVTPPPTRDVVRIMILVIVYALNYIPLLYHQIQMSFIRPTIINHCSCAAMQTGTHYKHSSVPPAPPAAHTELPAHVTANEDLLHPVPSLPSTLAWQNW